MPISAWAAIRFHADNPGKYIAYALKLIINGYLIYLCCFYFPKKIRLVRKLIPKNKNCKIISIMPFGASPNLGNEYSFHCKGRKKQEGKVAASSTKNATLLIKTLSKIGFAIALLKKKHKIKNWTS